MGIDLTENHLVLYQLFSQLISISRANGGNVGSSGARVTRAMLCRLTKYKKPNLRAPLCLSEISVPLTTGSGPVIREGM